MAQTPISASAAITSSTPTTLYTVPALKTAIVKSVLGTSLIGGSALTFNKVSGGITYPISIGVSTNYQLATGNTILGSVNLLSDPITLVAGESISVSTSTASAYKFASDYSTSFTISNVYYLNSTWIAIGSNSVTGYGVVLTSTNGTTWTQQTFNFSSSLKDLAFGASTFVAVGTLPGFVYTSSDLITWTARATSNTAGLNAVAYSGANWVAVGNVGQYIYTATPTGTWTSTTLTGSVTASIISIFFANSTWVFGLESGGAAISTNANGSAVTYPYAVLGALQTGFLGALNNGATIISPTTGRSYSSTNSALTWTTRGVATGSPTQFTFGASSYAVLFNPSTGASSWSSNDGATWTAGTVTAISGANCKMTSGSGLGYVFFINNAGTGGESRSNSSAGKGYPTFTMPGSGVILTAPNCLTHGETFSYAFGRDSSNTTIQAAYFSGSSMTSISGSSLTLATTGNPSISWGVAGVYYAITTQNKILKASAYNSYPTDTGYTSPVSYSSVLAAAGISTTLVLITSTTIYTSTSSGAAWTSQTLPESLYGKIPTTQAGLYYDINISKFVISSNIGTYATSSDGVTWTSFLYGLKYAATVNSLNLYQTGSNLYSSTTPQTAYTLLTSSVVVNSGSNVENMGYAGGVYYFVRSGTFITSTDLSTFTSLSVSTTAINNNTYINAVGLATDGTNLLLNGSTAFAYETSVSSSLANANVTCGIVEIS